MAEFLKYFRIEIIKSAEGRGEGKGNYNEGGKGGARSRKEGKEG
jgi:hypothetical protein